jgi:hypothetical protein
MTRTVEALQNMKKLKTMNGAQTRDAILGCYVAIHGQTLKRGAKILGQDLSPDEVEKTATVQMKSLMGPAFDSPGKEDLHKAKIALDKKMQFDKVPDDLKKMHDDTCHQALSMLG